MKMDKNLDTNGGDSPPYNGMEHSRQGAADALNELLDIFTNQISNGNVLNGHSENLNGSASHIGNRSSSDLFQHEGLPSFRGPSQINSIDDIDPSSPLGRSLQIKFSELEEISRRLKIRLDQVVCDGEILLSPDAEINDWDLEMDLNTDSHAEDLTPQEFMQLVQSQITASSQHSIDSLEKDDISK